MPHQLLKTGHAQSALSLLGEMKKLFPDRLYIELQKAAPEDERILIKLNEIAHAHNLSTVATHPIAYLKPEEDSLQRTLTAIRLNTRINEIPVDAAALPGAYFISPEKFSAQFNSHPEALDNIAEIVERCNLTFSPVQTALSPGYRYHPGTTALDLLRQKAFTGAVRRYGENNPRNHIPIKARVKCHWRTRLRNHIPDR